MAIAMAMGMAPVKLRIPRVAIAVVLVRGERVQILAAVAKLRNRALLVTAKPAGSPSREARRSKVLVRTLGATIAAAQGRGRVQAQAPARAVASAPVLEIVAVAPILATL